MTTMTTMNRRRLLPSAGATASRRGRSASARPWVRPGPSRWSPRGYRARRRRRLSDRGTVTSLRFTAGIGTTPSGCACGTALYSTKNTWRFAWVVATTCWRGAVAWVRTAVRTGVDPTGARRRCWSPWFDWRTARWFTWETFGANTADSSGLNRPAPAGRRTNARKETSWTRTRTRRSPGRNPRRRREASGCDSPRGPRRLPRCPRCCRRSDLSPLSSPGPAPAGSPLHSRRLHAARVGAAVTSSGRRPRRPRVTGAGLLTLTRSSSTLTEER
mmetsp:Transcript_6020/g.26151  ORF Transcript_6020/g.26151 Transcript_6020/m.26151 type:complete len:273 (+) Transcript_6020:1924-2742(+)